MTEGRKKYRGEVCFSSKKDPEKAGGAFFEMMREITTIPKDSIIKALTAQAEKVEKARRLDSVVREVHRLYSSLSNQKRLVELFRGMWKENSPTKGLKKALENFFVGLPTGWKLVMCSKKDPNYRFLLKVPQPPFTLKDKGLAVLFKNLVVVIEGRRNGTSLNYYLKVSGKTHDGPTARTHPHGHVALGETSSLCTGQGTNSLLRASQGWDIMSLYGVFTTVLTNYKRLSAYQPLDAFSSRKGYRCSKCGWWNPKTKSTKSCSSCGSLFCKNCAKENIFKPAKRHKCDFCPPEQKPPTPQTTCIICKRRGTGDRIEKCSSCGKMVCGSHRRGCALCSKLFCPSCDVKCPVCRLHYCRPHVWQQGKAGQEKYKEAGVCGYCASYNTSSCDRVVRQHQEKLDREKKLKKEEGKSNGD